MDDIIYTNKGISCPSCGGHTFRYEIEALSNSATAFCASESCKYSGQFILTWGCDREPKEISDAHDYWIRKREHARKINAGKKSDPNARAS